MTCLQIAGKRMLGLTGTKIYCDIFFKHFSGDFSDVADNEENGKVDEIEVP